MFIAIYVCLQVAFQPIAYLNSHLISNDSHICLAATATLLWWMPLLLSRMASASAVLAAAAQTAPVVIKPIQYQEHILYAYGIYGVCNFH